MTACAQSLYAKSQEAGEEAEEERNQRRMGSNVGGGVRGLSVVKRLGGGKA